MRVLLTGSSGRLGRTLAPTLRDAGHMVVGLDPAPGIGTDEIGSVADRATVDRVLATHGIEAVIHAGGLHRPDIARRPAQAFVDVNVTGTLNLIEAAVAAGHDRFVFTSTTSLMISQAIRAGAGGAAVWLDEECGPLAPRDIYGVTKLAAEGLCRIAAAGHGLATVVLRTARFFVDADDGSRGGHAGANRMANELLHRRLTVVDAARAHVLALDRAPAIGFDTLIVSAPPPFVRGDAAALKRDAAAMVARAYPDAASLYAARGWVLPASIGRVYDPARAERVLGFRCATDFATVLAALRDGTPLPFATHPAAASPVGGI